MEAKFLPIGSVVLLKGAKKKLMIMGYAQIDLEKNDKIYDYCGCLFPEGMISSDKIFVFNHNDIEQVEFKGYMNEEQKSFNERLLFQLVQENKEKIIQGLKKEEIDTL